MSFINKKAYPSESDFLYVSPPHNISQWIQAMRNIYVHVNQGMSYSKAFDLITNKWENMDKLDFKNWMHYYQSGADSAYKKAEMEKTAQYLPNAFFDEKDLRSTMPGMPKRQLDDEEVEKPEIINKQTEKQKELEREKLEKEQIDQQIKALIGRLNSAERLATTQGIAKALGPSFENWVRALHELKKEIQVAPFRSVKSELMTDLIIRKGNQLYAAGHEKSAKLMYKIAQIAPPPLEGTDTSLAPPSEPNAESNLPEAPVPDFNSEPSKLSPDDNKKDAWVEEFLNGLEGINDDKNDVMNASASDDLYVSEDDLKVYAQEVPVQTPGKDVVQAIPQPEGNKLEQALAGTTIDDVIAKLEAVSNIFKNREVPRQLAMVDIMMDQLGISSFFSELAEATSKALESNQYCATRVEDVLARLKGSINVPTEQALDLEGAKPGAAANNAIGLKNQLELEDQKEKARKKNREDLANKTEDAQIANPQNQAPVNTEALNQPTQVQAPTNPGVRV